MFSFYKYFPTFSCGTQLYIPNRCQTHHTIQRSYTYVNKINFFLFGNNLKVFLKLNPKSNHIFAFSVPCRVIFSFLIFACLIYIFPSKTLGTVEHKEILSSHGPVGNISVLSQSSFKVFFQNPCQI